MKNNIHYRRPCITPNDKKGKQGGDFKHFEVFRKSHLFLLHNIPLPPIVCNISTQWGAVRLKKEGMCPEYLFVSVPK